MDRRECMNIVIGSSKENAIFSAVTLVSLFDNNPDEKFNIYFYYDEPMEETLSLLQELVEAAGSVFIPKYVTEERKAFLLIENMSWWHMSLWYRYYCIEDLCETKERVLILGTDTLIQKPIRAFYESDMEDKCIVAIPDMGNFCGLYPSPMCRKYGVTREQYVNTDILLIEVKKANLKLNVQKMIYEYDANNLLWLDQDTLNICFRNLLKVEQDLKYNFMPAIACEAMEAEKFTEELQDAVIVHYAIKKPWSEYGIKYGHEIWLEYARKTNCYEQIMRKSLEIMGTQITKQKTDIANKITYINKMDKLFWIQDLLWNACDNGTVKGKLEELEVGSLAIYGYGKLGRHLLKYCIDNHVKVEYIIDEFKSECEADIPIIKLYDMSNYGVVDAIVVTPIQDIEMIKGRIDGERYRVISLEDLV